MDPQIVILSKETFPTTISNIIKNYKKRYDISVAISRTRWTKFMSCLMQYFPRTVFLCKIKKNRQSEIQFYQKPFDLSRGLEEHGPF